MRLYEIPIEIADYDNVMADIEKPDYVPAKATIDLDCIEFIYEQKFEKPACRINFKSGQDTIAFLPYLEMVKIWKEEGFAKCTGGPAAQIIPDNATIEEIDKLIKGENCDD